MSGNQRQEYQRVIVYQQQKGERQYCAAKAQAGAYEAAPDKDQTD